MWHVWERRDLLVKFRRRNLNLEVRDQLHGQTASPFGKYVPASIGGWVVPRATLGTLGKTNFSPLPRIETRFPGCPPRSLSSIRSAISRLKEWQRYRATDLVDGFRRSLFWFLRAGNGRSRWPRCLRRESGAVRLLGLRVRISPGTWMSVSCECYVCCQVELSATDRFLVQRSPTECGVCVIVI
jgi:hypothetical protein